MTVASLTFPQKLDLFGQLVREIAATGSASVEAERISERLSDRADRLAFSLCHMPAETLSECMVKASILTHYLDGSSDLLNELGRSLCRDIVRMDGLARGSTTA